MSLQCPKCHNEMHQYERNGVVVDQCTECKGLFLDRGELEKLVQAENAFYGDDDRRERERRPEPRYAQEQRYEERRPEPRYEDRRRYDDDDDDHRYGSSKKHKSRSFLDDLFG